MRLSDERWTAAAIIMCLYAIFIVWFCGPPMSPMPIDEVGVEEFRELFKGKIFEDEIAAHDFENFMSSDDGSPVLVTAKILYRDELKYPDNTPENVTKLTTVDDALSTLGWGFYTIAVQRGTVSLAATHSPATLFRPIDGATTTDQEGEDEEDAEVAETATPVSEKWSQVYTFRFRSRMDLLSVLLEVEESGLWWHKLAAVRALDVSTSQGTVGRHISPTTLIQMVALLVALVVYELTEFCFPESPDMKELRKLRKAAAKKARKEKKGDGPSRATSGTSSAAEPGSP
mmetsp:Transcript_17483/g.45697  ORF Transcript_17483/g.45697 Transcript_17483/m.45697 type:complete len:287 (-) Transcript_17483:183-1043(-)